MATYHRVYDSHRLQADCKRTGISSRTLRSAVELPLPFLVIKLEVAGNAGGECVNAITHGHAGVNVMTSAHRVTGRGELSVDERLESEPFDWTIVVVTEAIIVAREQVTRECRVCELDCQLTVYTADTHTHSHDHRHRHRIDKYLDTLLANQPISDGEATNHCQKITSQDGGLPELIVVRSCLTNHSEVALLLLVRPKQDVVGNHQ